MNTSRDDLRDNYSSKSQEELLHLHSLGTLTDMAYEVLETELRARGLEIPARPELESISEDTDSGRMSPNGGSFPLRRIVAALGLVACVLVGYWAWMNLSGGEGLTRNALRNGILAMVIVTSLSALGTLFSSASSERNVESTPEPVSEPKLCRQLTRCTYIFYGVAVLLVILGFVYSGEAIVLPIAVAIAANAAFVAKTRNLLAASLFPLAMLAYLVSYFAFGSVRFQGIVVMICLLSLVSSHFYTVLSLRRLSKRDQMSTD